MRRQDDIDPVAQDRFDRVWPATGLADQFGSEDHPGVISVTPAGFAGADDTAGAHEWPPKLPAPVTSPVLAAFSPGRRAIKALAVVAVAVVLVAAFVAWHSEPRSQVVTAATPAAATTPIAAVPPAPAAGVPSADAPSSPDASAAYIVVAVTGRVHRPGLVHLPPGSRVADAIAAAGGVLPKTDLSFVNLARKVSDGELIVIGVQPSPGVLADPTGDPAAAAPTGGTAPVGPVDLNTAGLAQLETLPGIGPALAQRILDFRTQHGTFHSVDELQDVSGIGPAKFAALKGLVTT